MTAITLGLPLRQVHLDFHNSPLIGDIGADWDDAAFAGTLRSAGVDSVTLFAKCHHGMSYYPSLVSPVHPALSIDLLDRQIAACHNAGIRCPIYVSVCWDVDAAARHPEWRQIGLTGRPVGPAPGSPGWPYLCLNTPYADEVLAQVEEITQRFECDGFFFDIVWYHPDACLCAACAKESQALGLDLSKPSDRGALSDMVARRFMERARAIILDSHPAATVFFNSRFGLRFEDERQYYTHVEVESLPTGGYGYGHYPLWARYARQHSMPILGMTGRFQNDWADWGGLKHVDALKVEAGTIVAAGGSVSIGDQLHPRGRLNSAVYSVIGEVFGGLAAVEAYCVDATPVADVAVLVLDATESDPSGVSPAGLHAALEGASKMLTELHSQFDVVTETTIDLSRYKVVVIPDRGLATPELTARLRTYLQSGGRLLLSNEAMVDHATGAFALADEIGLDFVGPAESDPDYFEVAEELAGPLLMAGFPYCYDEGPSMSVRPREGTATLAAAHESYFNRTGEHFSSHGFTAPRSEPARYPAVTSSGSVIYIHGPIFRAYFAKGSISFRGLVGRCLELLHPRPALWTDAPATCEVALHRQGRRSIVHAVNYHAERRSPRHVEALGPVIPLANVEIAISDQPAIDRVYVAPSGPILDWEQDGSTVRAIVPSIGAHAVIVFEPSGPS